MQRSLLTAVLCAALVIVPIGKIRAQDEIRTEQVTFPAGATGTTVTGTVSGRESVSYIVVAEAGQQMTTQLSSANTSVYFNIYEPGRGPGDEALANSSMAGTEMVPAVNQFTGTLQTSGTHIVSVYLYRNAAREGETATFELSIQIAGATDDTLKADFADGLQGGPDFWQVATEGGQLNIHSEPSTAAPVVTEVWNGDALKNLGCRANEGRTWCKVTTLSDEPILGWAASQFLVEGNGMVSDAPENDAKVPGTKFHSTGQIPCSVDAHVGNCDFGVVRAGTGNGYLTVTLPDASTVNIYFEGGEAASYDRSSGDSAEKLIVTRSDDVSVITIGTTVFQIPDAVISGG